MQRNLATVNLSQTMAEVRRKAGAEKGRMFCLMVAGETGLGKSTLVDSLFTIENLGPPSESEETPQRTLRLTSRTLEIEEEGLHQEITLVDTPGLGDAVDSTGCFQSLLDFINQQFERCGNFIIYKFSVDHPDIMIKMQVF